MRKVSKKIIAFMIAGILTAAPAIPASATSTDDLEYNSTVDLEVPQGNETGLDEIDGENTDEERPEGMDGGRTSAGKDASEEDGIDGEAPDFDGTDGESDSSAADDTASDDEGKGPVRAEISSDDTSGQSGVKAEITDADSDKVVISENDKPYLALGANLTADQKNTVLNLMGIDPANLDQYDVVTVTNEEEHQYLDDYMSASTIGTRALSSVVIVKRDKGDGIRISTKNISYCTIGMYKNALATAGLEDADVIVAGPFPLSGTAALIGAMKAYADMENTQIDQDTLDAAMNEIVVTGELNESLGDDVETEEFMAYVKQQVLEKGLKDVGSIQDIISKASDKFDISLDENEKAQISSLMEKISSLDIDVDKLLEQAGSIYESLKNMEESSGILAKIAAFFKDLLDAVVNFFKSLF